MLEANATLNSHKNRSFSRIDCLLYHLNFLTWISYYGVWHLLTWQTISGSGVKSLGEGEQLLPQTPLRSQSWGKLSNEVFFPTGFSAKVTNSFPVSLFEAAWFWLSASSLIHQIFLILHYVRDWTLPWSYIQGRGVTFRGGQIRVPVLMELMESRTTEGKQGARTYTVI